MAGKKYNVFNAKNLVGKVEKRQKQMDKQMEALYGMEHPEQTKAKKKAKGFFNKLFGK